MKKGFVGLTLVSILAVTGCGTAVANTSKTTSSNAINAPSTTSNSANNGITGYLYRDPTATVFIQYTTSNGQLSGAFYEAYEDANHSFRTIHSQITGTINNGSITINLTDSGQTYTGNLSGNTLDLAIPQSDGTVQSFQFTRGTLNNYNQNVAQIQSATASAQAADQQAAQTAALQQKLSGLESAVLSNQQAIESDPTSLQADVQSTARDIGTEKHDVAVTQTAEQSVLKEQAGSAGTQMDAAQVQQDAAQVQQDDAQIQQDQSQFSMDENALQQVESALQSDFNNMSATAGQLGVSIPASMPSSDDINQEEKNASSIDASTSPTEAGYVSESKNLVAEAMSAATKATQYASGAN